MGSVLAAERRLVSLVQKAADMPREEALLSVARVLDEIAVAYHDIPDCPADDREAEAAEQKFPDFGPIIATAFPEFGQYWCADQAVDISPDKRLLVGDAREDLNEILRELAGVRWRNEHLTAAAAAFYARLMQGHTLSHLLDLRRIVHLQLFGW